MATIPALRWPALGLLSLLTAFVLSGRLPAAESQNLKNQVKEIAGTAEFLRTVPKRFATLKAVDSARHRVTLLLEGDQDPTVWPLTPDAEVKVAGWWARLDQLTLGDRVWAWFKINRAKKKVALLMLADELSQQDINGPGVKLVARGDGNITLKPVKGKNWVLKTDKAAVYKGTSARGEGSQLTKVPLDTFKVGSQVYVQSAGGMARLVLDPAAFEKHRLAQKTALRKIWRDKGLPGAATFIHLSGEMDFMLDHEAMRWGRSLKPGAKVVLLADPGIQAVVKEVTPWRERTQLRLVVKGADLADLTLGQRLNLKMTPPSKEVEQSDLPPDLGRFKNKKDRVEWFLASIYCTCQVKGDGCTGQFYTLGSCNPNACGMPNYMRKVIGDKIDQGLTDRQIFQELLKDQGKILLRPHLLP
jgi:hypothetical protein